MRRSSVLRAVDEQLVKDAAQARARFCLTTAGPCVEVESRTHGGWVLGAAGLLTAVGLAVYVVK